MTLAELKRFDVGAIKPGTDYAKQFSTQAVVPGTPMPALAEIAADLQLPDGRHLRDLLAACPYTGLERLAAPQVTP